jgi:hypothetical protein
MHGFGGKEKRVAQSETTLENKEKFAKSCWLSKDKGKCIKIFMIWKGIYECWV